MEEGKKPDLTFYYSNKNSKFEVLAKCPTATELIATNIVIYANPDLTGPIGFMQQSFIIDGNIFSFKADVLFSTFNGTLTYYNIYPNVEYPFTKYVSFINTILSGTGNLSYTSGKVVTIIDPENTDTETAYVYFKKT